MSQGNIDYLMELWSLSALEHGVNLGPYANHEELYQDIDSIKLGSAPWKCFVCPPPNDVPLSAPEWQRQTYQVWYRDPDTVIANILANPDFEKEFDASPYIDIGPDGKRRWSEFMSGNFSWRHAVESSILDSKPVLTHS